MTEQRNILIVLAHPDPQSFNHAVARTMADALANAGHQAVISDLYAESFRAEIGPHDIADFPEGKKFHVQSAQADASRQQAFAADIAREQERVADADMLILQFPLWWGGPPAILKGWIDRVLAYGFAYVDGRRFDTGLFRGRRAMMSVTTGGTPARFSDEGVYGPIEPILMPIRRLALEYMGYEVAPSHIVYGAPRLTDMERGVQLSSAKSAVLDFACLRVERTDAWKAALSEIHDHAWATNR